MILLFHWGRYCGGCTESGHSVVCSFRPQNVPGDSAESTVHQTEDISGAQTKFSLSRYFLGTTQTAPFPLAYRINAACRSSLQDYPREGRDSKKGKIW